MFGSSSMHSLFNCSPRIAFRIKSSGLSPRNLLALNPTDFEMVTGLHFGQLYPSLTRTSREEPRLPAPSTFPMSYNARLHCQLLANSIGSLRCFHVAKHWLLAALPCQGTGSCGHCRNCPNPGGLCCQGHSAVLSHGQGRHGGGSCLRARFSCVCQGGVFESSFSGWAGGRVREGRGVAEWQPPVTDCQQDWTRTQTPSISSLWTASLKLEFPDLRRSRMIEQKTGRRS